RHTRSKRDWSSDVCSSDLIYAPHITEVAAMHPGIRDIGYHNIEYFTKQWDRFKDHPWGELAHSTHVTGLGTYDAATGEEKQRVRSEERRVGDEGRAER